MNKLLGYKYNSNKQYTKNELVTFAQKIHHWNKIETTQRECFKIFKKS